MGLAHILRAADSLASESLRAPPRAAQAALSTPHMEMPAFAGIGMDVQIKTPATSPASSRRMGLAHILRAADSLASESLRAPP